VGEADLAQAEGVWRSVSLDGGGELDLSMDGPQIDDGCPFTILFHERNWGKGAACSICYTTRCYRT
jgi:hypothetical protein